MLKGQDRPLFPEFYFISFSSLHLHLSFLIFLLLHLLAFFFFFFLTSRRGLGADVEKRELGWTGPTPQE